MIGKAEIEAVVAAHGRVAVAIVTEAKGSSPRDAGTVMLVYHGGTHGTIGGGTVEHRVIEAARALLANDGHPQVLRFPLGPDLDQCCGGQMTVELGLIDLAMGTTLQPGADSPLPPRGGGVGRGGSELWPGGPGLPAPPTMRSVLIYGAGHVGQALMLALAPLPFQTMLIDAKPGVQDSGAYDPVVTPLPEAVAEEASESAFHIVMTHSHAIDLEIVSTVMGKSFGFCGLIGSATKRALFERRLAERGVPHENIARLTCPIGLSALRDKRPEVIAASVAAQLLLKDAALQEHP